MCNVSCPSVLHPSHDCNIHHGSTKPGVPCSCPSVRRAQSGPLGDFSRNLENNRNTSAIFGENQRTEGTEGSAIKNHLIKRLFWYSCFVERCWFMRMLVMYPDIVTDKLNQWTAHIYSNKQLVDHIQCHCPFLFSIKPRSHCPGFQSRWRYGVDTGAHRDHIVATPTRTALNRGTPC